MKKNICISLIIILSFPIKAQMIMIDNIEISRVVTEIKETRGENEAEGPIVKFNVTIKNNTDSIVKIHPSQSNIKIKYMYKKNAYVRDANLLSLISFLENDILLLNKDEEIKLVFSDRIFLGTNILNMTIRNIYDYRKELLQVIPTLQILYEENNLQLRSNGIKGVELSDYWHIYR
jgi:hypothetical protein